MQWISDWLREIILVILLAAFIDLLLPNSTMQRYVKVVISLFILMTILSPIITLFKSNLDFKDWQDEAIDVSTFQPLHYVMEEGEKLRAFNEKHSIQYVENQTADMMKRELEKELSEKVSNIEVVADLDSNKSTLEIIKVLITLETVREQVSEGYQIEDSIASIEPMKKVDIKIELEEKEDKAAVGTVEQQEALYRKQTVAKVSRILEQNWNVPSNQLAITFME